MKLPLAIHDSRFTIWKKSAKPDAVNRQSSILNPQFRRGFTMVEIALCLAIIGFALVAIIAVLPWGMNAQRENRERTIINQDATVFVEAIRNGARGADDLVNYVYAVTNYQTLYPPGTTPPTPIGYDSSFLTSGAKIIGLLSTPEFTDINGLALPNLSGGGFSNHVVAYVRSMSGSAVEKPPQNNTLLVQGSFTYRVICENVPVVVTPNSGYSTNLQANLHDLQLTFLWPQLPNGSLPPHNPSQTYRTLIAGRQVMDASTVPGTKLYFFQPQFFINAP